MARVFSNDLIAVADSTPLRGPSGAITIGGWVYLTNSPGNYQRLFGKGIGNYGTSPYVSYNIQQNSTNIRQLEFNVSNATTLYASGRTAALSLNTWYFVAGRWSSGNDTEIRVFNADGTLFSSGNGAIHSGSISYDTTPYEVTDGGDAGSKPDGRFANLFVDDTAYSDGQIRQFMFTGRVAGSNNLHLPMQTATEVDISGNAGTITVTGTTLGDGPPIGPMFGLDNVYPFTPTADTTAPVLSLPTGTKTGSSTATGTVDTNEANGTMYAVVDTSGTKPSVAQIQAGQGSDGLAADYSANQAISSTGTKTFLATGLTALTTFYFYFQHKDAAGNDSTVSASTSFTTDAASSGQLMGSIAGTGGLAGMGGIAGNGGGIAG